MIECMRNAAREHMTLDEQISFCEEKSKNIKLKAEPHTFIDIKNSLEKLKNPWILVSERLPEKYGTYLVAWKPCGMSEEDIIKKCGKPHYYEMLEYDPDDQALWIETIEQAEGEYVILAWMPLPQPYSADSEKPKTNADRIRNMTDEELLGFLCSIETYEQGSAKTIEGGVAMCSVTEVEQWLKAESEEQAWRD